MDASRLTCMSWRTRWTVIPARRLSKSVRKRGMSWFGETVAVAVAVRDHESYMSQARFERAMAKVTRQISAALKSGYECWRWAGSVESDGVV